MLPFSGKKRRIWYICRINKTSNSFFESGREHKVNKALCKQTMISLVLSYFVKIDYANWQNDSNIKCYQTITMTLVMIYCQKKLAEL